MCLLEVLDRIFVVQQYEVIRDYTDFDVAEYYGATGTGYWSAQSWRKEVSTREVILFSIYTFLCLEILLNC